MPKPHDTLQPLSLSSRRTLVAGALSLALAAGGAAALAQIQSPPMADAPSGRTAAAPHAPSSLPSFADVAEEVTPAVVNVIAVSDAHGSVMAEDHQGIPQDGAMGELFKRFFGEPGLTPPHRAQAAGSGFLIDPDGHIVTNHHVVEGASAVTVTLIDGTRLEARIIGHDDKTDLALLKVDAGRPLPYVELGDSTGTRVGDWVLAVGNPFGLGGSVNAGIVSARGRDINSGPYDDYLQIDAPINRGHSGGPLFDARGRVIGVNTAIYSPSGGNVGIGFAIPVETVRAVTADLRAHGRVERGWLGVQIQPVSEELAGALGLARSGGVLVADVLPQSPAAASGLRAGDVILHADGRSIQDPRDLPKIVAAAKAGMPMALDLVRSGAALSLTVTVGAMPDEEPLAAIDPVPAADPGQGRLGLYLTPLTPQLRQERGLGAGAAGVFVARVEPGSPAEQAGIEAGTLISMVGGEAVSSPEQVAAAVRRAAEEHRPAVLLRIEREGKPLFIAVPMPA